MSIEGSSHLGADVLRHLVPLERRHRNCVPLPYEQAGAEQGGCDGGVTQHRDMRRPDDRFFSSPLRRHADYSFGTVAVYCCWISWATLRLSERTEALIRVKSSGVTTCPIASGFKRFRRTIRVAMSSMKSGSSARRASRNSTSRAHSLADLPAAAAAFVISFSSARVSFVPRLRERLSRSLPRPAYCSTTNPLIIFTAPRCVLRQFPDRNQSSHLVTGWPLICLHRRGSRLGTKPPLCTTLRGMECQHSSGAQHRSTSAPE